MQVFSQPFFAFVEFYALKTFPSSSFIRKSYRIPMGRGAVYNLNLFRLVWRSIYVVFTTLVAMLLPFFNDIVGLLGSLGFWPLTVYFPVEMYIKQFKVRFFWDKKVPDKTVFFLVCGFWFVV